MEENNNSIETTITTTTTEVALEAQVEAQAPTEVAELPAELAGAQEEPVAEVEASKHKHVAHADVPGLIAAGENPLMLRSPEAPHGYKLDGTPAAQRGRKAGSGQGPTKKVLANPKHGNVGKRFRAQEGAPYGVKSDGTPAKKRGRPSKSTVVVISESSVAEAQAIVEAAIQESSEPSVPAVQEVAAAVVEKAQVTKGSKVQMVAAACKTDKQAKLTGQVKKVSSLFAFVHWNNGQQQWRALETLQVVA